jgi:toxin HigB-1
MIQGFAGRETELFFRGGVCPARWRSVSRVVARKLDMIDAAITLNELRVARGNRLEALKGDRAGQYSVRVNDR